MKRPIRRRTLLGASVVVLCGIATRLDAVTTAPSRRGCGCGACGESLTAADRRLAALGVGLTGDPSTRARAVERAGTRLAASTCPARVRREFLDTQRVRRDFDAENVVVVDGWLLARSEAVACAYFAAFERSRA